MSLFDDHWINVSKIDMILYRLYTYDLSFVQCLEKIKAELLQDKVNEYNETTFIEPSITIIQLLSYGTCEYGKGNIRI